MLPNHIDSLLLYCLRIYVSTYYIVSMEQKLHVDFDINKIFNHFCYSLFYMHAVPLLFVKCEKKRRTNDNGIVLYADRANVVLHIINTRENESLVSRVSI